MSKFCENCGSELVEGNKFCSSCGADVSNQSSSNVNNVINSSEKEKVRKLITQLSQKIRQMQLYGVHWVWYKL